jgi:hypothetical protein
MSNNKSLFETLNIYYNEKTKINIEDKMKEIANCMEQNKLEIRKLYEKYMYTENDIKDVAKMGLSELTIFRWCPYDPYNPYSTSGMRIGNQKF